MNLRIQKINILIHILKKKLKGKSYTLIFRIKGKEIESKRKAQEAINDIKNPPVLKDTIEKSKPSQSEKKLTVKFILFFIPVFSNNFWYFSKILFKIL